jgi:hypothetical protein
MASKNPIFKNLEVEMVRAGFSKSKLADALGVSYVTFLLRMDGSRDFKLGEMQKIKMLLQSKLTLDELFKREA